jgi:hypothetical protein
VLRIFIEVVDSYKAISCSSIIPVSLSQMI